MTAKTYLQVASLGLSLLISGCTGGVRQPSYYTLVLAPQLQPRATTSPKPVTIAVRRFETPAYLRQGRIVYREHPEQVGFYEYHRWAVDPGAMVTNAVVDSLQSDNLFSYVGPNDKSHRAEYLLSGRLDRLDEVDYGDGVRVEATVSAQLINLRTGVIAWTGNTRHTSIVDHHDVYAVVRQMSNAVDSCLEQLVASIEETVDGRSRAAR